jgi:hypothetical protein
MGVVLYSKGELKHAIESYHNAINVSPDELTAWGNVFYALQACKAQVNSVEHLLSQFGNGLQSPQAKLSLSILRYKLNLGGRASKKSQQEVIKTLSKMDTSFVKNPKLNTINTSLKPIRFKEVVALVHFGRSGSGLLHSLIDGHPEISTMPSIYFSEFFDHFAWENLIAEGFDGILNRFMSIYDILFNASSLTPIKTQGGKFVKNLGQQEGLLNVGDDKNEVLQLDRLAFRKELSRLLDEHNQIDAFTFFKLIQASFDKALGDTNEKKDDVLSYT